MAPYFMVNEETLKRTPEEVREYLRFLRRRIQELEGTDSQRRIEELEATIRKLKTEIADLNAAHQQQVQQLQQQLADACAKLVEIVLRARLAERGEQREGLYEGQKATLPGPYRG